MKISFFVCKHSFYDDGSNNVKARKRVNESIESSFVSHGFFYYTSPPFFLRPLPSSPFSFSTFLCSIDSGVTRHARILFTWNNRSLGIRKLRYIYVIIQSFLIYLIYADLSRTVVKSKILWNDQSEDFATSNGNGSFWILHEHISLYISYVYNTLSFDPCFFFNLSSAFKFSSIFAIFHSPFSPPFLLLLSFLIENKDLLFFFHNTWTNRFKWLSNADEMSIIIQQQFLRIVERLIDKLCREKKKSVSFHIIVNIIFLLILDLF